MSIVRKKILKKYVFLLIFKFKTMNVFIYRKGALGDTIAFVPLLFCLKNFYKKIYFAGNYLYREIFQDIDFVEFLDADSRDVFDCLNGKLPSYLEDVNKFFIFSRAIETKKKNFFYFDALQNHTWFYKYPFDCLNLRFDENPVFLPINNYSEMELVTQKKFFLIHPGSGGLKKVWPLEHFFKLEEMLSKIGINCLYLLGESEERLIDKMKGRDFFYNLSFKKVCFLLTYALTYLGCDSGISHLAGIMNTKGVALFGESSEKIYKPWGNIKVLKSKDNNISSIKPVDVYGFLEKEELIENR